MRSGPVNESRYAMTQGREAAVDGGELLDVQLSFFISQVAGDFKFL
jgi:hypothetical protein